MRTVHSRYLGLLTPLFVMVCCVAGSECFGRDRILRADPPDSYVAIVGPISISGISPLPLKDLPYGEYDVAARGLGLPSIRGRFLFTEEGTFGMPWAPAVSILYPPGLTHVERGERRGWIFAGVGGLAGAMALISHADARDAEDRVERAILAHRVAVSEDAVLSARLDLLVAVREKANHEEIRKLWTTLGLASWIGAGVESLFLTPQPRFSSAGDGEFVAQFPTAKGWRAGFSSALVPGAGQRGMGRSTKANIFASSIAVLAGATISAHDDFLKARTKQAEAQLVFHRAEGEQDVRAARTDLENRADKVSDKNSLRWALGGLTLGAYLWNVVDAMSLGPQKNTAGLSLSVVPTANGGVLAATWGLP